MHVNCHLARAIGLFVAVATLACATTRRGHSVTSDAAATPVSAAKTDWVGTYQLVGSGFPEGDRRAQLIIARRDTTHAVSVAGPPGRLVSFWLVGDSALVVWGLPDELMEVRLRQRGDSVHGVWQVAHSKGAIRGARAR
jgi:hypothetical protein